MGSNFLQEACEHQLIIITIASEVVGKGRVLENEGNKHFAYIGRQVPIFLLFLGLGVLLEDLH